MASGSTVLAFDPTSDRRPESLHVGTGITARGRRPWDTVVVGVVGVGVELVGLDFVVPSIAGVGSAEASVLVAVGQSEVGEVV